MESSENNRQSIEESEKAKEMLINKKEDVKDPYFKDMDTGWAWVVLFGSFVTFCLCGATQFASGIVHIILLEKYKASLSVTSVAGAIHLSLISLGAPLSTVVSERYTCRVSVIVSGVLFFLGYLGTAFAPNIECVMFTYGVVAGLGGALGYTPSMVVLGYNFHKRRNMVMGIALSGIVVDSGGTYDHSFYMSGVFLLFGGIISAMASFMYKSKGDKVKCNETTVKHIDGYSEEMIVLNKDRNDPSME